MRIAHFLRNALSAITVSTMFIIGSPATAAGDTKFAMSVPKGFEDLTAERRTVLDIYYGGKRLGEARAIIQPGLLRFEDPSAVSRLIPHVAAPAELTAALSESLPANVALSCQAGHSPDCGTLDPKRVGIILNEEQFRVEIFINPQMLKKQSLGSPEYLPDPEIEPSLISLFGAALSGSSRGDRSFHLQNRSVASIGKIRLRSDSSLASRAGLSFDNLTIERDRADWRYSGGIFWAPGTELVGRRKILGFGATTQFDTRSDKEALLGLPLLVSLQSSARVEVLVNDRLISSGIYPAGQPLIDTSQLPNGSYEVVLRIKETGRPTREERRFFTKGSQMAPLGQPLFSAFAGFLPKGGQASSFSGDTIFYQASATFRLSPAFGIDGTLLGTQDKGILAAGLIFHTRYAQVRLSGLASTSADAGAVFRAATVGNGPVTASIDVRKIISKSGEPLLPVSASNGSFSEDPQSSFGDRGSYTQALGIVSYRVGDALLRLNGGYRRAASDAATYDVGAALDIPIVRTGSWELQFQSNVRKSERNLSSFFGLRFHTTRGRMAFSGSAGLSQSRDGDRTKRMVGESQMAWFRQDEDQNEYAAEVAYGQDANAYARASGTIRSALANGRADLLHDFGGNGSTQIAGNVHFGLAASGEHRRLAGRQFDDSAVIVAVSGGTATQTFEVMVDNVSRGKVADGKSLSLFLQPYRTYGIRLRPSGKTAASFDTATREITLYPGNVTRVHWQITPIIVLFGRAVDADGRPLSHAEISGPHGIGRTNGEGYFQVETATSDFLRVVARDTTCSIAFPGPPPVKGYLSAGDVVCR